MSCELITGSLYLFLYLKCSKFDQSMNLQLCGGSTHPKKNHRWPGFQGHAENLTKRLAMAHGMGIVTSCFDHDRSPTMGNLDQLQAWTADTLAASVEA